MLLLLANYQARPVKVPYKLLAKNRDNLYPPFIYLQFAGLMQFIMSKLCAELQHAGRSLPKPWHKAGIKEVIFDCFLFLRAICC